MVQAQASSPFRPRRVDMQGTQAPADGVERSESRLCQRTGRTNCLPRCSLRICAEVAEVLSICETEGAIENGCSLQLHQHAFVFAFRKSRSGMTRASAHYAPILPSALSRNMTGKGYENHVQQRIDGAIIMTTLEKYRLGDLSACRSRKPIRNKTE